MTIDNRSPKTRLLDDIHSLERMASINYCLIEECMSSTRSVSYKDGIYTFNFSDDSAEDLVFAASDLNKRAQSIVARLSLFEQEERKQQ